MTPTPLAYLADPGLAEAVGDVPGLRIITSNGDELPAGAADAEIYVPRFLAPSSEADVIRAMHGLKLLQLATAGAEVWLDKVPPGVTLATARGAHGSATAEWAVGALLAVVREFPTFLDAQRQQRWQSHGTDRLEGKRVLVVGAGDLGAEFSKRLIAFGVEVTTVARTARPGVHPISDIKRLLPNHDVVVLVIPLTAETTGLVDAGFLAAMPDGAILVNAARGGVVVTDALVAELESGRLRAALDVTDPEPLPAGHPLWTAPGVFITPHVGGSVVGTADRAAAVVRAQLIRYVENEPLANVVRPAGY